MKMQFKFREDSGEDKRRDVLRTLKNEGANDVRQLFPEEKDPGLASLYVAEHKSKRRGQELLKILQSLEDVDFAEEEARRRLIK